MGKRICKYVIDMYRSSNLEGVFVLTDEEYAAAKSMNGFEVHYGEVSGKHSDVSRVLNYEDIQVLSDKEEEVAFFERILPYGAGFGFKDYWFSTEYAYDNGYEAGSSKHYKNVKEGLKDYPQNDNDVRRKAFEEGFANARK